MAWQDVPEGTVAPVVHCVESGPENQYGQLAGFIIHLAQEVDAAQLVLTMAKLWNVPGTGAVATDNPEAKQLSLVLQPTADAQLALSSLRQAFVFEFAFTGAILVRGCGCARCQNEGVVWLGVRLIDRLTPEQLRSTLDILRAHPEVVTIAVRDETLILKMKKAILESPEGDAARLRELMAKASIHVENPMSGYVLRLAAWAADRSPHDW